MTAVFYDDRMIAIPEGFSPSAGKPKLLVEHWEQGSHRFEPYRFPKLDRSHFYRAHEQSFVDRVLSLQELNGHGNRSAEFAETLGWTAGSHYAAALYALEHGVACSPTSGFHHAGYADCGGFCTFNALMATALALFAEARLGTKRVLIVDYDYHYGDGTADIIETLGLGDRVEQINGGSYSDAGQFLRDIKGNLDRAGDDVGLVMYQAGADMYSGDPIGGLLSIPGLYDRDRAVFEWCRDRGLPVVWNLAGGYTRERDGSIPKVLKIHTNTLTACNEVFGPPVAA